MKKIIIVLLTAIAFVQLGCNRTSDIIGPDACPSDGFAVTSNLDIKNNADSDQSNLNFVNSYANISATFNETITYKLTITTAASEAVYVYEGKGSSISLNWYGNSTNGKYFKQGDVLTVKLTNICKTEPLGTDNITINTIVGYAGFGYKVINYDESPSIAPGTYGDLTPGTYGASILMTSASVGYTASPQGGNYFKYKANSVSTRSPNFTNTNGDNITWYFGGADFFTTTPATFSTLGTDPTKVYLNFFAKGAANSQAQMIIDETAHGVNLRRKYLANVGPDWALYSVRLSDIGIINPSAIYNFSLNVGASLYQDTSAEVDLDLVIFTKDKPF